MSALLLVTATILTRHAQPSSAEHAKLDTAGVLQLTWLLGTRSDILTGGSPHNSVYDGCKIADHLRSNAKSADIADLREAGKEIPIEVWGVGTHTHNA